FLKLSIANFAVHALARIIHLYTHSQAAQLLHYLLRIGDMPVSNGDEARLHRRNPDGKGSRRMLDEYANEAFQRTINGAVNHNRHTHRAYGGSLSRLDCAGA